LGRTALRERYAWTDTLEKVGADAVIVTGCEPRAPRLAEEPYWNDLTRVIDWAWDNTASAVFSCLAAHAAVLHLDGIERLRAGAKISGVFPFERATDHPLTSGFAEPVLWPHSRHNCLSPEDLTHKGYRILTRSAEVGTDMFVREGPSLFVFLQGHPEYEGGTLLREFRRDFARFVRGEQAAAPAVPRGYFEPQVHDALKALMAEARPGHVTEALDAFDEIVTDCHPEVVWGPNASRFYRNWLGVVAASAGLDLERNPPGAVETMALMQIISAAE
jgi:homoserine O-succinyltransferase